MAYAIQSSFSYHMGILPWTRFLSKMDDWLTIQIFVKVKLHFFISWHMTFKAHFHNTGASYHNQFPFKNVWPWKCFNCTLLLWPLWYIFQGQIALLYFMTHFYNTDASYHRPDSFWKWNIKLIFKTPKHLTMSQIPFENGWHWKCFNCILSLWPSWPWNCFNCTLLLLWPSQTRECFLTLPDDLKVSITLPWTKSLFKMGGSNCTLSFHIMWHWTLLAKGSFAHCAFLFIWWKLTLDMMYCFKVLDDFIYVALRSCMPSYTNSIKCTFNMIVIRVSVTLSLIYQWLPI